MSAHSLLEPYEVRRLAALRATGIMDTPPELSFDSLTWLAKFSLGTPMAAVALIDENRQWLKSRQGPLDVEEPRSISFCNYAVESESPMIVLDTIKDSRLRENPSVLGPPFLRFYVAIPIVDRDRNVLGTLCVMDTKPRASVSSDQLNALHALCRLVSDGIELHRVAAHDALTGLLTHAAFRRAAQVEADRSHATGMPLSCIVLDIDHFKQLNDSFGHAAGDIILRDVAASLRLDMRPFDLLGRIGGEEFGIVLPQTDHVAAMETAERLRRRLELISIVTGGEKLHLSGSFGVSACEAADVESALVRADLAMYQSKRAGRNRVTLAGSAAKAASAA